MVTVSPSISSSLSVMSNEMFIMFHTFIAFSRSSSHFTPASTKLIANGKMPRICRNSSVL